MPIDGKRLKELRENRGLYLHDMADFLGVTRQAYMKYENGETKNPRQIDELAEFFNVSTDYLLGITDSKQTNRPELPSITPRDEKEIAQDLEKMLSELSASTAMGGEMDPDNAENMELLKNALGQAMTLAKRVAKQKFTPKKYRKTTENSLQNYGNDK